MKPYHFVGLLAVAVGLLLAILPAERKLRRNDHKGGWTGRR